MVSPNYDFMLRLRTTTDLSADEIHELGLAEVARIQAEMLTIIESVGFEGDLQAFFHFLREDERFVYPNTNAGRQGYITDSIAYLDFINQRLPDYFGILPKAPLEVRRVEPFREQDGAPQHYSRGAPDGSRPGIYYAHLSDMNAMPKHLMEAIAYHEGNPGHHMQLSIAQETTLVPKIPYPGVLYRVHRGLGALFRASGQRDGRLPGSLFRLRQAVHRDLARRQAGGGYRHSRQRLVRSRVQSPTSKKTLRWQKVPSKPEVRRYFVMPGQATAYKIGMLKILELRDYASEQLGDRFDIRTFHDTVLGGGALPLTILERRVNNWVAEQLSDPDPTEAT